MSGSGVLVKSKKLQLFFSRIYGIEIAGHDCLFSVHTYTYLISE